MAKFTAACVQINAKNEMAENIADMSDLIRRACDQGADFITTPECVALIEAGRANTIAKARPEDDHPALAAFIDLAQETGAWLLAGSLTILRQDSADDRMANRSYLIAPDGRIVAKYDKINMFDVNIEGGESHRESRSYRPGEAAVMADLPWGKLGMTVCYDLRFPKLYRDLAQAGADFLTVPSAFTRFSGKAHWHVLLRARAIETGCFVIAAAQTGEHAGGRKTYGHSLIISPWGEVLADGGEECGIVLAEIDTDKVAQARQSIPSLQSDQLYSAPQTLSPSAAVADAAE